MLQLLEVLFGQVVLAHELVLFGVEPPPVTLLLLGLQGLEHGRSDHQVGEDADDEGESPGVLSLHGTGHGAGAGAEALCDLLLADSGSDRGGDFGDGAVLSAPPPHHSWLAPVFGIIVTDL